MCIYIYVCMVGVFRMVGKRKGALRTDKATARTAKKARKAKKDPNKPKRPPSAFFVFLLVSLGFLPFSSSSFRKIVRLISYSMS